MKNTKDHELFGHSPMQCMWPLVTVVMFVIVLTIFVGILWIANELSIM